MAPASSTTTSALPGGCCSAMCRRVRIGLAAVPVDYFAALEAALAAAFGAAALVDLLAAVPTRAAALAGTAFDAAALRAGAFLAVVLVADFATGETLLISYEPNSHAMGNVLAA